MAILTTTEHWTARLSTLVIRFTLVTACTCSAIVAEADWFDDLAPADQQKLVQATTEYQQALKLFQKKQAEAAIRHMEKSIALAEPVLGKDHGSMAGKYSSLGVMLESVARYGEAVECYREALRINEVGLKLGEASLDLFAKNRAALGMGLIKAGKPAEAEAILLEALATAAKAYGNTSLQYTRFLNNVGYCYRQMENHAEARRYYVEALNKRRANPDCPPALLAAAFNNLGELLVWTGDYAEARTHLEEALAICRRTVGDDHERTATILNNIGYLLCVVGDYDKALDFYNQSLEIRRKILPEGHPEIGRSLHNRGAALLAQGSYKAAIRDLGQGLDILVNVLDRSHPDLANAFTKCGECYYKLGNYQEARRLTHRARKIRKVAYRDRDPRKGDFFHDLGVLSMHSGAFKTSEFYLSEGISSAENALGKQHIQLAKMHENLGLLHGCQGQWEEALAGFDASQRIIRHQARTVLPGLSPRGQGIYRVQLARRFNRGLACAYMANSVEEAAAKSAEWVINNKAVVHEALAQQTQLQFLTDDDNDTAKQLAEVRRQLSALAMTEAQPGETERRAEKVRSLQEEESKLARKLAAERGLFSLGEDWYRLSDIRQRIPDEAVLVEFARITPVYFDASTKNIESERARYIAWVIPNSAQGGARLVDLGAADEIDRLIETTRAQIDRDSQKIDVIDEAEATEAVNAQLQQLARRIYWPLIEKLGRPKELILSPDANLWLVPWAALPIDQENHLLIEQSVIRFLTTARDLVRSKDRFTGKAHAPLMFANPNYDLAPEGVHQQLEALDIRYRENASSRGTAKRQFASWKALPRTETEALRIKPNLARFAQSEPDLFSRDRALESVAKQTENPAVLVFSTHGFFLDDETVALDDASESPLADRLTESGSAAQGDQMREAPFLRCGLLLAGCNQSGVQAYDDGILTGAEILGINLRGTRLVVLSACETGVGKIQEGEGVVGLRQAFQMAGAEAVVASLWEVDDAETATLMDLFFENLAKGQSGPVALRNAQLNRIEERNLVYEGAHPYFWAAMTFTGG